MTLLAWLRLFGMAVEAGVDLVRQRIAGAAPQDLTPEVRDELARIKLLIVQLPALDAAEQAELDAAVPR